MENITDILCQFAVSLKYEKLPESTIDQTKKFITDYFAASLAGMVVNHGFNSAVLNIIKSFGGTPQASILLEKSKFSSAEAAYMNAIYAHGADLDDGNRLSAGHIGAAVISSVFALAETRKTYWRDIFTAINVGFDFFNRIGGAAQPSLYNKGFHSTGIVGALAAAAACSKLLGLSKKQIYNSVSLAAVQASGLIIIDETGQGCKPINPANAAKTGVVSTLLAEQGVEAPLYPLESNKGWFHAFSDGINTNYIFQGLGEKFTIDESYLKIYPTCRHTHSCIEAALEIRKQMIENGLRLGSQIEKIEVYTYASAIKSAGSIRIPRNSDEAKFSIRYAIAMALYKGKFELKDLNPTNVVDEVKRIINIIEIVQDNVLENRSKGIRGARVKIVMKNKKVFESSVLKPKGEGDEKLGWRDIEEKLYNCGKGILAENLLHKLLEECKNIREDKLYSYPALLLFEEK